MLISFCLFKYLKIKLFDNWYLNDYSRCNKRLLEDYGDWEIKYIYLVKEPISKFSYLIMNIVTLNSLKNAIKKYSDNETPNHIFLLLELQKDNQRKTCILEKNTCLNIGFNYMITDKQIKMKLKPSENIKLNDLLEKTKKRITSKKFFNFELFENNCQNLATEILKTVNKYNEKTKIFLYQEQFYCSEFLDEIFCFDFNKYLVNSCFNIYNMIRSITNRMFN
jgi:hypothetical protein